MHNAVNRYNDPTDATIANGASVRHMAETHTLWECCDECKSLHIYCDKCKTYAQLVSRNIVMDDYNVVYAWRSEDGTYHSTSAAKELGKKYGLKPPETPPTGSYNDQIDACTEMLEAKLGISSDEACDIYDEFVDNHMYEFGDSLEFKPPLGFNLEDLNIYCLNPNDTRLIHPDESGLANYGKGFNIMERSCATWRCSCNTTIIEGHND